MTKKKHLKFPFPTPNFREIFFVKAEKEIAAKDKKISAEILVKFSPPKNTF